MNYYISDLHFGQENISFLEGRPFKDLEDMERGITERWNARVADGDTVYVLGDFILKDEQYWPDYLKRLNGGIVLLRGNHDPKSFSAETRKYLADIRDYMEVDDCGRRVVLCHYPIPFYEKDYEDDSWMLYGHVHNAREYEFLRRLRRDLKATKTNPWRACGNFVNVGCIMPWMDYTPRTLDEIIENNRD